MFFKKLVQQHRVDPIEAQGFGLPFLIAHHQVRRRLGHFLGDEAKHFCVGWINIAVVAVGDRLERVERFAGLLHGLDLVLVASRGNDVAKFTGGIYLDISAGIVRCRTDASDSGTVGLASKTDDAVADAHIAAAFDIEAGIKAQGRVVAAGDVVKERFNTVGRVEGAGGVLERTKTSRRIVVADGVDLKRSKTSSRVVEAGAVFLERTSSSSRVKVASGVAKERVRTDGGVQVGVVAKERLPTKGRVAGTGCVAKERHTANGDIANAVGVLLERLSSNGRVLFAVDVEVEGIKTHSRVEAAGGVVMERLSTKCRVPEATSDSEVEEGVLSLSRVVARIASIWCRGHGSRRGRKPKADEHECDEKETETQRRPAD